MSLTLEQLQHFCAQADDEREYLRKPFKRGEFVYATNGHIGVRVPADGLTADELPADKLPQLEALLSRPAPGPLKSLAVPIAAKCLACKGRRTVELGFCKDCAGQGGFDHCGLMYDCKNCDGQGWTDNYSDDDRVEDRPCEACLGLGRQRDRDVVDGVGFQRVYLNWIMRLPGALFAVGGPEDTAAFTFDGGNGVLMPMRA